MELSTGDQLSNDKKKNESPTASTDTSKKVNKKRIREWFDRHRKSTPKSAAKQQQPNALSLTKTRRILLFGLILFLYLLVNVSSSMIGPFFPEQATARGVSGFSTGIIAGSSALFLALFSPIFGYFLQELGIRFTLVSGVLLTGGAHTLLGFTADLETKYEFIGVSLAVRIVQGIGQAACITTSFSLVAVLFPAYTGLSMGIVELIGGLGYAIGPVLGGALHLLGGFKLVFLVTGGFLLLYLPILILSLPSIEVEKGKFLAPKTVLKLTANLPFIAIVLSYMICSAGVGFFVPTFAPFISQTFKTTKMQLGLLFSIAPISYLVASIVAGKLSDLLGPRYLMCGGLLVLVVSYTALGPAPFISEHSVLWLTILAYCTIGVGLAAGQVPAMSAVLELTKFSDSDPQLVSAMVSGLLTATRSIGEFIGPLIGGGFNDMFDFPMAALMFALLVLSETLLLSGVTVIDLIFIKLER